MGNAQRSKKQDPARDEYGRIDVPVYSPGTPGNPSVEIVRLGVVGGQRADSDQTVAPISSINNFVMLPDGTGIRIRDGFEYNERYSNKTTPAGRKALMVETAPPGVDVGYRHQIMNTAGESAYIEDAEYIRDRTKAFGENGLSEISFISTDMTANVPPISTGIQIGRSGRLSGKSTVRFKTFDGTATAAAFDYTPKDVVLDLFPGTILLEGVSISDPPATTGKYFFVFLSEAGPGAIVKEPSVIKVSMP